MQYDEAENLGPVASEWCVNLCKTFISETIINDIGSSKFGTCVNFLLRDESKYTEDITMCLKATPCASRNELYISTRSKILEWLRERAQNWRSEYETKLVKSPTPVIA